MKKIVALLLAVAMIFAMGITVFADTALTITDPTDADGSFNSATYEAYKILNATNNADDHTLYSYALNTKYTAILQAVTGKTTEEDIVAFIGALSADGIRTFANDVYAAIKAADPAIAADETLTTDTAKTVAEGYWLIAQTSAPDTDETKSLVMIDTTGKDAVTVEAKKEVFTVKKQIRGELICEEEHTHVDSCYDWSSASNAPVGATLPFKIETDVPSNMADYEYTPYFIVGDKMSDGLTLNKNTIAVTIGGEAAEAGVDYTVRFNPAGQGETACANGYTFQIALIDPEADAGKKVVVTYTALVNENAAMSLTGNANEADVTFTTDPNTNYGGTPDGGFPKEMTVDVDGKTPKAITVAYTTGIKFKKVDGKTNKALNGAEFTVTGTTQETSLKWEQKYTKVEEGSEGTGDYYLLKNGNYTTQECVTADKMVEYISESFDGGYVVAGEEDAAAETDKTIGGIRYRLATSEDFGSKTIYTPVLKNSDKYAETVKNYTYSEGWVTQTATGTYSTVVKVDENGIANLPGLEAGTYTISETVVPEGYNKIDDFTVVIAWTAPTAAALAEDGANAECSWTATLADGTTLSLEEANDLGDLFGLTVKNNAGTELPSTGGFGTTLLIIVGSVLFMATAVVLVTKKRMYNEG